MSREQNPYSYSWGKDTPVQPVKQPKPLNQTSSYNKGSTFSSQSNPLDSLERNYKSGITKSVLQSEIDSQKAARDSIGSLKSNYNYNIIY